VEAGEDVEMIFVACRSTNDWKGHSGKRGQLHGLLLTDATLDSLL